MATYGNNHVNDEITQFRNELFTEERQTKFAEITKNPAHKKYHEKLKREQAEKLYIKAKEVQKTLEDEELSDVEREELEIMLIHLLAAIIDTEPANEKGNN